MLSSVCFPERRWKSPRPLHAWPQNLVSFRSAWVARSQEGPSEFVFAQAFAFGFNVIIFFCNWRHWHRTFRRTLAAVIRKGLSAPESYSSSFPLCFLSAAAVDCDCPKPKNQNPFVLPRGVAKKTEKASDVFCQPKNVQLVSIPELGLAPQSHQAGVIPAIHPFPRPSLYVHNVSPPKKNHTHTHTNLRGGKNRYWATKDLLRAIWHRFLACEFSFARITFFRRVTLGPTLLANLLILRAQQFWWALPYGKLLAIFLYKILEW